MKIASFKKCLISVYLLYKIMNLVTYSFKFIVYFDLFIVNYPVLGLHVPNFLIQSWIDGNFGWF